MNALKHQGHGEVLKVMRPDDVKTEQVVRDIASAHVLNNYGQPWVVLTIDGTNFMEALWAVSATEQTTKKYGIVKDATLRGLDQKFKVALNTLCVIELMPFTPKEVIDACVALADRTVVVVSREVTRKINHNTRSLTYPT